MPKSTVIILLYSFIPLKTSNSQVELEKQRLRDEFLSNCSPQQKSLIEKHYKQHQLSQQKYKPCDLA